MLKKYVSEVSFKLYVAEHLVTPEKEDTLACRPDPYVQWWGLPSTRSEKGQKVDSPDELEEPLLLTF